jgi:hypothetical protein
MVAFIAQIIISFDPLRAWVNKKPNKSAYVLLALNVVAFILSFALLSSGSWPTINWLTLFGLVGVVASILWLGANLANLYAVGAFDGLVTRYGVFGKRVQEEVVYQRIQQNTVREEIRGNGKDDKALEHLIG